MKRSLLYLLSLPFAALALQNFTIENEPAKVNSAAITYSRVSELQPRVGLEVGSIAPNFTQNDPDGKPVSLSSLKGKYVLIDFWASWCGPCRDENPNLVAAYNKFKDRNFTILGVSLDRQTGRDAWLKAIKDDQLTWIQVSDLNGWNNEVAELYSIRAIPQSYLLDPTGKIIAKNLRGAELHAVLDEILASK